MTDTTSMERLALQAKALSHPARLAILETLGTRGTCVCGEVVEVVGLAQSTVSQHLKVLREAGLVRGTPDGTRSCYCLDESALEDVASRLSAFVSTLTSCCSDDDCCC
ncbi:ArsR/SmtB family transcription factor [Rubrivirga sp.]|uniref:ArsR/SmtB family transcription factor n=1 Tax=Rubrivirga sp. TaxID=1885344 RepID=UPI003C773E0B